MAGSRIPGISQDPWTPHGSTPGPLGTNSDASDPNTPRWFVGNTPGPVGVNDYADPDAIMCRIRQSSAITQAPTLKNAGDQPLETVELESMSVSGFAAMESPAARKQWIQRKLGPYEDQLHESADTFNVPVQLLAVVIANELLDISWKDVVQENFSGGSLGIAQVQVDTAIRHKLTPQDAAYRYAQSLGMERILAAGRLKVPQYAIHAAAKEIRILFEKLKANPESHWAKECSFAGERSGASAQQLYSAFPGGSQEDNEAMLAELIAAAYNSPDIIIAKNPLAYSNAITHGKNAGTIARVFYRWQIFRPKRP